jgi:hypothetical protein
MPMGMQFWSVCEIFNDKTDSGETKNPVMSAGDDKIPGFMAIGQ